MLSFGGRGDLSGRGILDHHDRSLGVAQHLRRQPAARTRGAQPVTLGAAVTGEAGLLNVAAAFPGPPFHLSGESFTGLEVEPTQVVAGELGLRYASEPCAGEDFEGIFAGIADGRWTIWRRAASKCS